MTTRQDNDASLLHGHRSRLRTRLEKDPLSVADYEILELVLGLSITRKDTKPLARELLNRFDSIRGVLDARPDELLQIKGFGESLMSLWRLLREVLARYAASPLRQRIEMASPEAVAHMARHRLAHMPDEECWLALVDAQNRLIYWDRLRQGGISSISLQPRDVLEVALLHKASGIILVHNHPGGNPEPSHADLEFTKTVEQLAPQLGLRFLDHVIVTSGDCYSLAQGKLLHGIGGL